MKTIDGKSIYESSLESWGFQKSCCDRCGVSNEEIQGMLMQCSKCKKAYYCSSECFNADVKEHSKWCGVGNLCSGRRHTTCSSRTQPSSNSYPRSKSLSTLKTTPPLRSESGSLSEERLKKDSANLRKKTRKPKEISERCRERDRKHKSCEEGSRIRSRVKAKLKDLDNDPLEKQRRRRSSPTEKKRSSSTKSKRSSSSKSKRGSSTKSSRETSSSKNIEQKKSNVKRQSSKSQVTEEEGGEKPRSRSREAKKRVSKEGREKNPNQDESSPERGPSRSGSATGTSQTKKEMAESPRTRSQKGKKKLSKEGRDANHHKFNNRPPTRSRSKERSKSHEEKTLAIQIENGEKKKKTTTRTANLRFPDSPTDSAASKLFFDSFDASWDLEKHTDSFDFTKSESKRSLVTVPSVTQVTAEDEDLFAVNKSTTKRSPALLKQKSSRTTMSPSKSVRSLNSPKRNGNIRTKSERSMMSEFSSGSNDSAPKKPIRRSNLEPFLAGVERRDSDESYWYTADDPTWASEQIMEPEAAESKMSESFGTLPTHSSTNYSTSENASFCSRSPVSVKKGVRIVISEYNPHENLSPKASPKSPTHVRRGLRAAHKERRLRSARKRASV